MTVRPAISGDLVVGSVLTGTTGTWTGVAPFTYTYQWKRCDVAGASCTRIHGATSSTYTLTGDDPLHTLRVSVRATDGNGVSRRARSLQTEKPTFALGSICNDSGVDRTRPATLEHIIVILMENRDAESVTYNSAAPYFNELIDQCGSSTEYLDNLFPNDINSLSHYLALVSGSNCNVGLGTDGEDCIDDDDDPSEHQLDTVSIFEQVSAWQAYQEDMPSNCDWGNPASGTNYYVKHNPPPYFSRITDCGTHDIGISRVDCSSDLDDVCSDPQNEFVDDLENDTLPQFAFVTPDIDNDMHDGGVTRGDNWMHTYLPLIFASPAYLRGGTAVYVVWDEQGSFDSGEMPNLFLSPYIRPTVSDVEMNHFSTLRAWSNQLGIGTYLGCASGTPPGGHGSCPPGSTEDLRAIFNF
ncbi:MAG: hypothetical protein H0V89_10165 [Deltaproteobacteria bacterium]|nr:hypothetical protein [Deltaproteobacteria bacterium]